VNQSAKFTYVWVAESSALLQCRYSMAHSTSN